MEAVLANQARVPAELTSSLELMAHMADSLDLLIKAPWPEVDLVGDKNPFRNFW
jgi:hypothetical protein